MATLMDEIVQNYSASLRDRASGARVASGLRLPVPQYPNMSGQQASDMVRRDVFGPPTGLDPTLRFSETRYQMNGWRVNSTAYYDPINGLTSNTTDSSNVIGPRFSSPITAADLARLRRIEAERQIDKPGIFSGMFTPNPNAVTQAPPQPAGVRAIGGFALPRPPQFLSLIHI
jgi:hypothetical protein